MVTVEEALSGQFGSPSEQFRYEHRTRTNQLVQSLAGVVIEGGEIMLDSDRPAVRTCKLTMDQAAIDALPTVFDPASDHIAIFMDILVGGATQSFQVGLFRLDVVERVDEPESATLDVQGADVAIHLLEDFLTASFTVVSGADVTDAIRVQLDLVGLSHNIPAAALTMPVARTWGPATPRWDIVRDLAFAINRFTPWAQGDGTITTRERITPSSETPDVTYSTEQEPRLLTAPTARKENRSRFPNRAVVLLDHPDRAPLFELRVNNDPSSPISIASTGKELTDELAGGIVVDTSIAGDISEYHLRDAAARALLRQIRTLPDPRRDAHEFYQLNITTIEANTLWQVLGWTLGLATGEPMVHELGRAAVVAITEP